ncbi:MAG: Ppx/GppA phosphatase family protein [Bdellovibrionota bacterium]
MQERYNSQTYAAIDIGTNSIHLVVAEVAENGAIKILDSDKIILRLGDALNNNQCFDKKTIDNIIKSIKSLKQIAEIHKPILRCVATHAVREAKNNAELIAKTFKETGINIEIVDGLEEARLISLGIKTAFPFEDKNFLSVDIGGGSTEFIIASKDEIEFASSLKLGAVTLTKQILRQDKNYYENFTKLENHINDHLMPLKNEIQGIKFHKAIASSGTAKSLAFIDIKLKNNKSSHQGIEGYILSEKSIEKIYKKLFTLKTVKKIRDEFTLDTNRAEIILAGCSILMGVTKLFSVKNWYVSTYGLREGLVIDTHQRQILNELGSWTDVRWKNVKHLGKKFYIDEEHATRVLKLATNIFKQLEVLLNNHPPLIEYLDNQEILEFAAWLHECGKYISFPKFQKHSQYIIQNSRLMGFTQREKEYISLVARFHRKGVATQSKAECQQLEEEQVSKINYLSGILRIATILSRTRRDIIADIKICLRDNCLHFMIQPAYEGVLPVVELQRFIRKAKDIKKSLGVSYEIIAEFMNKD